MIEFTTKACPVQAEGKLVNGKYFYFRSRYTNWAFYVGGPTQGDAYNGTCVSSGHYDDGDKALPYSAGYMPLSLATFLIQEAIRMILDEPELVFKEQLMLQGEI